MTRIIGGFLGLQNIWFLSLWSCIISGFLRILLRILLRIFLRILLRIFPRIHRYQMIWIIWEVIKWSESFEKLSNDLNHLRSYQMIWIIWEESNRWQNRNLSGSFVLHERALKSPLHFLFVILLDSQECRAFAFSVWGPVSCCICEWNFSFAKEPYKRDYILQMRPIIPKNPEDHLSRWFDDKEEIYIWFVVDLHIWFAVFVSLKMCALRWSEWMC